MRYFLTILILLINIPIYAENYQGDYSEDSVVSFHFLTTIAEIPTTLAGTPVLSVYKNSNTTETTTGVTLNVDFNGITGFNNVVVNTNSDAFYVAHEDYSVVITTGTVGGDSRIGTVVGEFSIHNRLLGTSSSGAGGLSTIASDFTLTTGSVVSGTITNTEQFDTVYHIIDDVGSTIDVYYQFDVGSTGKAIQINWDGYIQNNAHVVSIGGWDWISSSWKSVGLVTGSNPVIPQTAENLFFTDAMTGTGLNLGIVRCRFTSTLVATVATDRILVQYTVISPTVGYENGSIWIDTVNGTSGTELYVNGTADNPVDTLTDAITISNNLGIKRFFIAQNSTLQFTETMNGYFLDGIDYTLDLNGQQVDGTTITGAVVFGTATGNGGSLLFERCKFGNATLPEIAIVGSAIAGIITASESGTYFYDRCASAVAGTATPCFDFGVIIGNTAMNMRHYSGGIEIENMQTGDTMSLEGNGQLIINASCTGGIIAIRGNFTVTDNASGAVTLSDNARYDIDQIANELATYDSPTNTEMEARTLIAASYFDPANDDVAVVTNMRGTDNAATETKQDIIDSNVDSVLIDTSNTLPNEHTLLATSSVLATVDSNIDVILVDTGTTLPSEHALLAIETKQDSILTDTGTTLPNQIAALNDPTPAQIAAANWNALKADYTTANTFGDYLDTEISSMATENKQDTIIGELALIEGVGFLTGTHSLRAIIDTGNNDWSSNGVGSVPINHTTDPDYYVTVDGVGYEGALIIAYLTSDYETGNFTSRGHTTSIVDGSWKVPLMLTSGFNYTLFFSITNQEPMTETLTVP